MTACFPDIAQSVHHNMGSCITDNSKPKYCNSSKCIILTSKDKQMLHIKYKEIYKSIQGSSSSVQYLEFIFTLSFITSSVAVPFLKFICPIHIANASCSV